MADTSITVRLIDETRAGFATINSSIDRLDSNVRGLQGQFVSLGRAANSLVGDLMAIGTALATSFVVKEIVKTAAEFESLRASVGAVTKDVKVGNAVFEELKGLAVETVFGVEDLTKAYIKMSAAGVAPTRDQLKLFNDVASVSADRLGTLEAISDLFARTVGGGLGLEELNRLADRGIPVYKILGDQLGVTRLELSKLGQSAEGAKLILDALQTGLQKEFGGAADRQAGTLTKAFSELKDAVNNAADSLGQAGLNAALSEVARNLSTFIRDNPAAVKSIGADLGNAVRFAADAFKFLATNIDLVVTAAGIFFTVLAVQRIVAVAVAIGTAATAAEGLAIALNRVPLAAIATALGIVALKLIDNTKETDKSTQATQSQIRAVDNAAESSGKLQSAIDEQAKKQAVVTQASRDQTFQTLSLSDQISVLEGNTGKLNTVQTASAQRAQELLKGTGDVRTEYGKYVQALDQTINLTNQDSVAKRISTETTKALEAAQKTAKEENIKLTDAIKNQITASVEQKIVNDETNKAMVKATEALAAAEAKTRDSIGQYLAEIERLRADQAKRTIQNQDINNKELETLRLNFIAKDLQFQRDAQRNTLDDLGRFDQDVQEATRKRNLGIYTTEEQYAAQVLALQQNFQNKYKSVIDAARTVGFTDAQIYLDRIATLEREYQSGAIQDLETFERIKAAITLQAQQRRVDEAQAYRISEGGAEAAYTAQIKKLNDDLTAGLIKTEEDKNTLLRKYNKEYRDGIASEYSTLYADLNNQIMKFTGQTQEQFSRTKEIVKLVFGVDLQDLIKQFFASAIRYVIGFREGTQGEMNLIPNILKTAFGDGSTNILSTWISGALNLFKGFGSSISDIFSGIGGFISNLFKSGGGGILDTITSGFSSVVSTVGNLVSGGASTIGNLVSTGASVVSSAFGLTSAGTSAAALTAAESGIALGGMGLGSASAAGTSLASSVSGFLSAAAPIAGAALAFKALFDWAGSDDRKAKEQRKQENAARAAAAKYQQDLVTLYTDLTRQGYQVATMAGQTALLQNGKVVGAPRNINQTALMKDPKYGQNFRSTLIYLASGNTEYGAKGLAYSAGNLITMPTVFGTRSGLAVGGEMGTEAIMPLGRDSQGRLGVNAMGGAAGININFTINAVDSRGIDQLLVERRGLITNIVRTAVSERGGRI